MIPANTVFPKFVPDQLLTSEDLNQLFGYLDEQGRMTRTNLIGIGIVCGLEVKTNAAGTEITITKGCGVTSEGYLITVPEKTYTKRIDFDPIKPKYYEKFVDLSDSSKKFDLWELKEAGVTEGTTDLTLSFLNQGEKVVMLFVELLEEDNKNCNPNSCDDKGINVTITFRPLLVAKQDVDDFGLLGTVGNLSSGNFTGLEELRMRRFDVPNTHPVTSLHLFNAYKSLLSSSFFTKTETALTAAYTLFAPFVADDYPNNPFAGFASSYAFLNNGSITLVQTLHLQYYYDLFADFLAAYEEFRKEGSYILSVCVPDSSLFPRHLLLGEAITSTAGASAYRHYFIYSPLFEKAKMMSRLKSLFHRLVLLKTRFLVPINVSPATGAEIPLRITPSKYGELSLSVKSIPYYYQVNVAPKPLYQFWDFDKTRIGIANKNLSYHAGLYNTTEEYVYDPLHYDLEPYNFLRIEGHIGKQYLPVLQNIQEIRDTYRLPFEVVALKAAEFSKALIDTSSVKCGLHDLELNYDIARREYEAVIGLTIEWLDDNRTAAARFINTRTNKRLEKFIQQLVKVKQYMVDDLPQFITVYNTFFNTYEYIEQEAEAIRALLVGKQDEEAEIDHSFLEDLIDHFDDVLMTTKKGAFRALKQEFDKRFYDIYAQQFFSYYAKHHPGLQHKAGVTMGGTFIVVYHQKAKKGTGDELVDSIADGTVIADFFLPYLCCSDCPPVRFEFPNSENPKLTLALEVNPATNTHEYCESDKGPYKFTVSPEGGTLEPLDGVSETAEGWRLRPAALGTELGDNDKIEKNFVYKKGGESSPVLKVTVYNRPEVDFTATPSTAAGGIVTIQNLSKYASQYEWDFGDGSTSTAEQPGTHTYATSGSYVITLKATNIPGCSEATEKNVRVEFQSQKTCGSLEEIIGDFNNLASLPPALLESFKQVFQQYPEVEGYFKQLLGLIGKPIQEQIDFFETTSVVERLTKWLSELDQLIKESRRIRLPALYLYRVLVRLAEYIACIQSDDIDQAKVTMLPIFELIMRHLEEWKELIADFSAAERNQLVRLKQEAQAERLRLNSGEAKPLYKEVIQKLIDILNGMGA